MDTNIWKKNNLTAGRSWLIEEKKQIKEFDKVDLKKLLI